MVDFVIGVTYILYVNNYILVCLGGGEDFTNSRPPLYEALQCQQRKHLALYQSETPEKIRGKNFTVWDAVVSERVTTIYYWASEASPTLGCSIEISRDIYIFIT